MATGFLAEITISVKNRPRVVSLMTSQMTDLSGVPITFWPKVVQRMPYILFKTSELSAQRFGGHFRKARGGGGEGASPLSTGDD